jgi:hypothetical protein
VLERRLTRRAAVVTAVLVPGAVALTGCKDDAAAGAGTPGAVNGGPSSSQNPAGETPTTDPAVVAALTVAATQVTQLSQLYANVSRKFPALRAQLAAGAKYHASHLVKLKETDGVAAKAAKAVVVPTSSVAALTTLAKQEALAAATNAAAAAKLSGAPARLLAEIAAAQTQLSSTLTPPKKRDKS